MASQESLNLSAALLRRRLKVVELLAGLGAEDRRVFRLLQLEAVGRRLVLLGGLYSVAVELRLLHLQLLCEKLL